MPQADVAPQKKEFTEISEKILGALAAGPKHTREVVAAITGVQATAVLETIHELVARERVVITNDWRLRVADRVELPGRPNCEECLKVLKRELGL